MRPYILAESNWKFIKDQQFELAVLPWGATEAHNYHMPYGTDIIEADKIGAEAGRIAWDKGAKLTILPTIPFGVNTGQSDILLDINMNPSTQYAILEDVIQVLDRQGIHKFIILNSHGGNDFKTMLRELGLKYPNMFLSQCHWFKSIDKTIFFDNEGDHADEMETSLLLHLTPELVLPLHEAGDGADKRSKIKAFRDGWAWAERPWSVISKDTGVGNPKLATAKKGKDYFEIVTEKVGDLFYQIAKTEIKDLYQ